MNKYKLASLMVNMTLFLLGMAIVWFSTYSLVACLATWVASIHIDFEELVN